MVWNGLEVLRSDIFPELQAAIRSGLCTRISKVVRQLLATGEHLHLPQTAVRACSLYSERWLKHLMDSNLGDAG
jgi:hypothetical protein